MIRVTKGDKRRCKLMTMARIEREGIKPAFKHVWQTCLPVCMPAKGLLTFSWSKGTVHVWIVTERRHAAAPCLSREQARKCQATYRQRRRLGSEGEGQQCRQAVAAGGICEFVRVFGVHL